MAVVAVTIVFSTSFVFLLENPYEKLLPINLIKSISIIEKSITHTIFPLVIDFIDCRNNYLLFIDRIDCYRLSILSSALAGGTLKKKTTTVT